MKELLLDHLIYLFTSSSDRGRPQLAKPSGENDIVYATDAQVMIAAPKKYFKEAYETNPQFPDCERLLPKIENPLFSLNADDLVKLYKEMPLQDIYALCDACEGEGKHKCTCGHKHDCGECNGSGKSQHVSHKGINPDAYWKIEGGLFSPERVMKIVRVVKELGEEKLYVMEVGNTMFIKIADVRCKICAWIDLDDEEKNKVVTDLAPYKLDQKKKS